MKSELSFLIELLLKHKLEDKTKDLIAKRIEDVELDLPQRTIPGVVKTASQIPPGLAAQAPSTQALLAKHPDLMEQVAHVPPPLPVAIVAHTPAAVAAMNSRQDAINASLAGKTDKTTGRPRKF